MRVFQHRRCGGAACAAVLLIGFGFGAAPLWAQSADVTYVQGGVDLKRPDQPRAEANIGDTMLPGDTIITGSDGLADLQKSNLAAISVSPGTVFTLRQLDQNGTKRDVLSVSLGELAYKLNELGGREPLIATMSATAGIRGTVLKVYAGADGSSLFVVQQGLVSVTGAGGKSVNLTPNEGVQVSPGQPPGQKIKLLYGKVDYRTWNAERLKNILLDPVDAVSNIEAQLDLYIEKIRELAPEYAKAHAELQANRAKLLGIKQKEGEQAMQDYYRKHVYPMEAVSGALYVNLRYYTLSALSLRRYVLGRIYVRMTSMYINDENNLVYRQFIAAYKQTLSKFQRYVVPQLVPGDI